MKSLLASATIGLAAILLLGAVATAQADLSPPVGAPRSAAELPGGFRSLAEGPLPPDGAEPLEAPAEGEFAIPFLHFTGGKLHAPDRHVGRGDPMVGTSWLNRPWSVGWFFGGFFGDEPQAGDVAFDEGLFGGYRFGYDFDHFWGVEARYGFGHPDLVNLDNDLPLGGGQVEYLDVNLLYYFWGDSAWRPFAFLGLGAAWLAFQDEDQRYLHTEAFQMPWGFGVKRRLNRNWALRFDLTNHLSFDAGGVDAMNNLTLTGGVEVHFGGRRPSYFPWHPGIHMLW